MERNGPIKVDAGVLFGRTKKKTPARNEHVTSRHILPLGQQNLYPHTFTTCEQHRIMDLGVSLECEGKQVRSGVELYIFDRCLRQLSDLLQPKLLASASNITLDCNKSSRRI